MSIEWIRAVLVVRVGLSFLELFIVVKVRELVILVSGCRLLCLVRRVTLVVVHALLRRDIGISETSRPLTL